MAPLTISAVVEDGLLRPLTPRNLPNGSTVELEVRPAQEPPGDAESLEEIFRDTREEAAKYPQEWWDDFDRLLAENRVNFPERT